MLFNRNKVSGSDAFKSAQKAASKIFHGASPILANLHKDAHLVKQFIHVRYLFYTHPFIFIEAVCAYSKMGDRDLSTYKSLVYSQVEEHIKDIMDIGIRTNVMMGVLMGDSGMIRPISNEWLKFGRVNSAIPHLYSTEIRDEFIYSVIKRNAPAREVRELSDLLDSSMITALASISELKM